MVGLREIAKNVKPTPVQIDQIRRYRNSIEKILKNELSSHNIRVYYAGSYAKNTAIKQNFDLDLVIRFPTNPNYSTKQCYDLVYQSLRRNNWNPRRKNAAIRVSNLSLPGTTTLEHADIVPEQLIQNSTDCMLWLNKENKTLKTSVHKHIEEITKLHMNDLVRLLKFWKYQHKIPYPSFILEQCLVRWANDEKSNASKDIVSRLQTHINYISRRIKNLSLRDPANPYGNIITNTSNFPTEHKNRVAKVASDTYLYANNQNWDSFFKTRF